MTRKHFAALAAALAATRPPLAESSPDTILTWNQAVGAVASACASFNPNFDRARFLAACNGEG